MASQIGANSRARESILGHNLHSEEHERNLMSFPSILHFGPSLPSPAFSDPPPSGERPEGQHHNVRTRGASSATPTRLTVAWLLLSQRVFKVFLSIFFTRLSGL